MTLPTRILIVEDESIVALDIRTRLESLGYQVVAQATNGIDAIQRARETRPDIILMDIKIQGELDGIQTAHTINAERRVPIIYLTAFADEATLQRAKVTDAFGYILKPFEERELATNIEIAVYKHRMERSLHASETRLRTVFDSAIDGIFIVDQSSRFLDINPSGCAMFGYTHQELIGADLRLLLSPEDANRVVEPGPEGKPVSVRLPSRRLKRKTGGELWVEITVTPMEVEDEALSLGILRDISEQVKAEAALRESEERYALAARAANDGLWDWNLRTNTVYYSRRWKALLGYEHFELSQQPKEWLDRIHPEDLDQVKVSLSAHMKGLTRHFESEHRMQHKDGTYRWMLTRGIAVQDSANFAYRFTGSHTDITARKQAEQQLMHDALHDSLTGLPNRTLFLDRLSQVLLRTHRKGDQFAVLFLDLDRFKVINDSLGHQSGDNLLIQITARLHACLRSIDTIARLGGDEFVVLLADITDDDDAGRAANRILESLAPPFELSGREIFVSASIGVVRGDYTYERPEDVLRDADIAMYQAKASGKACAVIFEPAMRKEALSRLEIESDLRQAIARQELSLHYQPIVSLVDGRLVGFEALLRWTHPQRGNIPPSAFIPIAEDTGLIIPIGWWVLNEACQQLRAWQHLHPEGPPLTISVNISGRQLTQPDLINKIRSILEGSGIPASQVRLEITESTLVHNSQDTLDVTHQLRQLGLQLHIDDFGTGYSSLSYIHSFPVNTIKIDRTFINRIGDNGNPTELVASILRFAHDLGMEAIAEGIETPEQLSRLQTLACPYGQGYLFSKPLPAEQAETLLSNPTLCVQSQSRQTTR